MTSRDLVPATEARAALAIDVARKAIAEAKDIGDVRALRDFRDKAAAIQHYQAKQQDAQTLADDAGEVKLRAEAALGQLDTGVAPRGVKEEFRAPGTVAPLDDVQHNTRAAWRKLGALTDRQFEKIVRQMRDDPLHGVSTSRALAEARKLPTSTPTPKSKSTPREAKPKPVPDAKAAAGLRRAQTRADFKEHLRLLQLEVQWLERNAERADEMSVPDLAAWSKKVNHCATQLMGVRDALAKGGPK